MDPHLKVILGAPCHLLYIIVDITQLPVSVDSWKDGTLIAKILSSHAIGAQGVGEVRIRSALRRPNRLGTSVNQLCESERNIGGKKHQQILRRAFDFIKKTTHTLWYVVIASVDLCGPLTSPQSFSPQKRNKNEP